jgi:hypothetical protein
MLIAHATQDDIYILKNAHCPGNWRWHLHTEKRLINLATKDDIYILQNAYFPGN